MKLIKFTSILLCIILLVSVFAGCDTPEESKSDTSSKDPLLNTSEDVSETVSEEVSAEVTETTVVAIENRYDKDTINDTLEPFYHDDEWVYSFANPISGYVYVVYSDGTEQKIKEALAEGRVDITILDEFEFSYYKHEMKAGALSFEIIDKRGEQSEWNDTVDTFYTDEDYKYSFPNWDMHKYVIVEYEDGITQNVKEALEAGYIVITDLDIFNIEYLKSPIEE